MSLRETLGLVFFPWQTVSRLADELRDAEGVIRRQMTENEALAADNTSLCALNAKLHRVAKGRPKKSGSRHPNGKLVQKVEPNAKVVELRRAMIGPEAVSLSSAENPMGLALERGWISEDQHRAGVTYATAYRRSHPQRRTTGLLPEAPEHHYDPRPIGQMGSAEIAVAFERILAETHRVATSDESTVEARRRYNRLSYTMQPDEQNEVFLCFCLASWPQWILQRCAGRFDTHWERKHRLLVVGLSRLADQLAQPRKSA